MVKKMKKAYKVFEDYFESQKPSAGIHSLREYIDWFGKFGEITTPINSSSTTFKFTFDSTSEATVLGDLLKVLKDQLDMDFFDEDDDSKDFKENCCSEKSIKLYSDSDHGDCFFYRVLDLKSEGSFIHVYTDFRASMDEHPDFEERLNQMESWDEFESYEEDEDGYVSVDWKDLDNYIRDHFIRHVYGDLNKLLKGFTVLHCAGHWYGVYDSIGESYYVLAGYNPKSKCGEAYVLEDFSR